jgi:hypothetical protein
MQCNRSGRSPAQNKEGIVAQSKKKVSIPAPNIGRITILIRGKTPLLQNSWTERTLATMPGGPLKGKSGKNEKLTQDEEYQEALDAIRMPSENGGPPVYGFAKEAVVHGMASAAGRLGDHKMTEIRAAVAVASPDDRIPIQGSEPTMDSRAVHLTRTSNKVANRPRFWPWEAEIPLEFDRGVLNEEAILRILADMGRGIGLGSYRPENKGTFGTFEVVDAWGG